LLAGLSDDDPAGITTYSILGADYGYQLLWVLTLSTAALPFMRRLAADPEVMGAHASGIGGRALTGTALALVVASVLSLAYLTLTS